MGGSNRYCFEGLTQFDDSIRGGGHVDGHVATLFVVLHLEAVASQQLGCLELHVDVEGGVRCFGLGVEHDEYHVLAGCTCIDEGIR